MVSSLLMENQEKAPYSISTFLIKEEAEAKYKTEAKAKVSKHTIDTVC